jgi:TetR/AcrR family transcriptional repressor of nem operon
MGRHKQYDRETIARKAMAVFWRHGYEGTSTQMLLDEMGVNRFSLYAEFGNKEALYEASLRLYDQEVVEQNLAILEAPGAGLDAVAQFLQSMVNWASEASSAMGCFMCNAATERAPTDALSRDLVHGYVDRLGQGFTNCLNVAQAQHQLRDGVQPEQEGRLLTMILLGLLVQLRAQVPAAQVQVAGQGAMAHLHRLSLPGAWQPTVICSPAT